MENPRLGVAPVYRTIVPPPPYNPSLYPPLYDVHPPAPAAAHNLPEYVALIGVYPVVSCYKYYTKVHVKNTKQNCNLYILNTENSEH